MKILFIGDSITDCGRYKDQQTSLGQGYALMVAGELSYKHPRQEFTFINKGISGNKITDLLARWKRDCINLQPDLISILVGINDVWHEIGRKDGVSAERFEQLYDIILDEARTNLPGAKIVLCEPFVLKADYISDDFHIFEPEVAKRQLAVKRLAGKYNCVLVPLQDAFNKVCETAPVSHWLSDGVHPTPAGNMLIAQEWIKYTKELM